ncbi:MAG: beta-galactosidase [Candidatus Sumerlaeota bacterium]|nr:beta-galactosidase [Candidatus Sumerlaeota bacterium]
MAHSSLPKIRVGAGGRGFATPDGKPFVPFGVNYYRAGTGWAPQVWKKWDEAATRKDFARMKELGVSCVRVFLSFGSFYQEAGKLNADGLSKFDQFLAIAEEAGIYVHPTGPDHWEGAPDWARGDPFADEALLSARERFWSLFAARYRGRGAIFAYDLLNEPSVRWSGKAMSEKWNDWLRKRYGEPGKAAQAWGIAADALKWDSVPAPDAKATTCPRTLLLDYQHFREHLADEWTRRQAAAIKAADPEALVTVGCIQWAVPALLNNLSDYAAFRPERQARFLDFLEIHFYPLEKGAYHYDKEGGEARNLAYLQSLVNESERWGKPVVLAEFGWYGGGAINANQQRHPAASEEDQARWCRRAVESTEGLACGWLNWGLYDCPEAGDVSQLTGLLTANGAVKAWGREFKTLASRLAGKQLPPRSMSPRPALDWDRCLTDRAAGNEFRKQYLEAFLKEYKD